jgi:single-stranded DNA-binding protein
MINNVTLTGRLTRDPELRYTPSNKAVATATIAVDRNRKDENGERQADFINLVFWNKQAETLANYVKKGHMIGVVGSIQTRNYENQQGQRVYVTEVVVNSFTFLESRSNQSNQGQNPQQGGNFAGQQPQNNGGFQQQPQNFAPDNNPFGGNPMDISDDDLPF